jgi:hypothetical protein
MAGKEWADGFFTCHFLPSWTGKTKAISHAMLTARRVLDCDLRLTTCDALTNGSVVSGPVTNSPVDVPKTRAAKNHCRKPVDLRRAAGYAAPVNRNLALLASSALLLCSAAVGF